MANGHGGERAGAPGKAYGNRTDLNTNKQPQQVATGQAFGKAAEQKRALAQMPLPQAPPPPPVPGQVVDLFAPTARPDEPVTAGAPFGPGPGPAVGGGEGQVDQDLVDMAKYLPTLELMAGLPGASVQMRNLVRRIRGSVPPGAGR